MKTNLKSMLGLVLALTATAAQADWEKVKQLQDYYDQGTIPSKKDALGAWTGRCFNALERTPQVLGAMLIGKNLENEFGPLFEEKNTINFRMVFDSNPRAYDQFDMRKDSVPPVQQPYAETEARVVNDAYVLQYGTWGAWTSIAKLRKYQDYLVAIESSVSSRRDKAEELGVIRACYFFKKVL